MGRKRRVTRENDSSLYVVRVRVREDTNRLVLVVVSTSARSQ